jgi:flagellar basal body-associated protein FliL
MAQLVLLDVAPNPVATGALLVVILLVVGLVLLLAIGLVGFLWYRKRGQRGVEMTRPDVQSTRSAQPAQPSKPNQP